MNKNLNDYFKNLFNSLNISQDSKKILKFILISLILNFYFTYNTHKIFNFFPYPTILLL